MSAPLIDTHAHLDNQKFKDDLPEVLRRADEAGISHIITIGCDLESSRQSCTLAATHQPLYAAVGVHPHEAASVNPESLEELRQLAGRDKVVAIGEIGLDYYRDHCPRDIQRQAFRSQLELARELGLPVIIHDRDAHDDVLEILRQAKAEEIGGVLHCFSGNAELAQACMDMGFFISFAGPLTYPRNEELRAVARSIPTEYLLVETDAPYLAPQKFRGKRNEPAHMRQTAEKLAELKGVSVDDLSRITRLNSVRLFGVGEVDQSSKIAYQIRESLYLNITNRCTNSCRFCAKFKDFNVKGHQLKLDHEPDCGEILAAIGDPTRFQEVVFCGYGEPLLRLDLIREVAAWLKGHGIKVRINTDGQANLVHGRNILPELEGLVDTLSVSLNAADAETYQQWCQSRFGEQSYQAVKDFLRLAGAHIPEVVATAVTLPGIDIQACEKIAAELGVSFRKRDYNEVG